MYSFVVVVVVALVFLSFFENMIWIANFLCIAFAVKALKKGRKNFEKKILGKLDLWKDIV